MVAIFLARTREPFFHTRDRVLTKESSVRIGAVKRGDFTENKQYAKDQKKQKLVLRKSATQARASAENKKLSFNPCFTFLTCGRPLLSSCFPNPRANCIARGTSRVLKLDRRVVNPTSLADICQEDPVVYTPIDMIEMLDMIHEGNRTVGGLSMTAKGYGIVGFVRFLDCYYLNFITQRRLVSLVT